MPRKRKNVLPRLIVPKNATKRQIYAIAKKEFSAADLQKYTEMEAMVPAEKLLAELESIHKAVTQKRQKENTHASRRR